MHIVGEHMLDLNTLGVMPCMQVIEFDGKSFGSDWCLLEAVSYDTHLEAGRDLGAGAWRQKDGDLISHDRV